MRKLVGLCGLLALLIVPAMAQDQPAANQDKTASAPTPPVKVKRTYTTPKFELSAGYTYRSYYSSIGTLGMNGGYGSLEYNLKRWLGVEAEALGVGKNQGFLDGVPFGDTHIFTLLVGPRIYPLGHRRLTPFGHFLYGAGYYRNAVPTFAGIPSSVATSAVLAWEAGGGLDYNLSQRWGIRMIQADFGSANFSTSNSPSKNQGSHRFSVGFVYRFGKR
jgi:opacity protein-like surface antigen